MASLICVWARSKVTYGCLTLARDSSVKKRAEIPDPKGLVFSGAVCVCAYAYVYESVCCVHIIAIRKYVCSDDDGTEVCVCVCVFR